MSDQLGLFESSTCACGCGRPVPPSSGRGRPAQFASSGCRVRAHRQAQDVTKFSADHPGGQIGGSVSEDADLAFASPGWEGAATGTPEEDRAAPGLTWPDVGHFARCPGCESPDFWVSGLGVALCPRCPYQRVRRRRP